jgi:hypothetical protein
VYAQAVVGVPAANADVDDVIRGGEVAVQQLQRARLLRIKGTQAVDADDAA